MRASSGRQRFNVLGALDPFSQELITITNDSYINSGYVVYGGYVVFLVLISLQHRIKRNSMTSLYTMKSYCFFGTDN